MIAGEPVLAEAVTLALLALVAVGSTAASLATATNRPKPPSPPTPEDPAIARRAASLRERERRASGIESTLLTGRGSTLGSQTRTGSTLVTGG